MLNDSVSSAADHEARNECLIEIDEAWELCRDHIDLARIALGEALESSRATFEDRQRQAADGHQESLTEAWNAYKGAISGTPSANRRELIAEARDSYKKAAATVRGTFDREMGAASDEYAKARREARAAYDLAVEEAFELHRDAVQDVRGYFEAAGRGGGSGEDSADSLELAAKLVAREHERQSNASGGADDGGQDDAGGHEGERGSDVFMSESAS